MKKHTLLIGLDGATFAVLDKLFESGDLPFLASFFAGGVRANLRTVVPPLTPPAWTSLMTGCTPGRHGVFDFFRMESVDSRLIRFFTSYDVQCETIWSLASAHGLRVTALNFPAMFPAPRVNGFVVPGWVPWRQLRLACWPEDLFDRLKTIPGFQPRELAMDIKLEERAAEGCDDHRELGPWIQLHSRRERNWLDIFRHLHVESPSELTAVLFDGPDKLQHLCWRFLRPEDATPLREDWEFEVRGLCLEYYRGLDRVIEEMCALAGPETTVIIASDHGFGASREVFHVNAWLERQGYLRWSEAAAQWNTQGATLGVGQVARHTWMLDWDHTKAFATTPTSNGIHIVVAGEDGAHGVPKPEYAAFRARLVEELLDFRDPSGERVISRIWTREEAFGGPHASFGPDLTLLLRDGGLVSILPSAQILLPRAAVLGAHHPVGVFAARGPGIRPDVRIDELSILDIAPLVLYSLGLPVLSSMQGRVPEEIFEEAAIRDHPVSVAAMTTSLTPPERSHPGQDTASDQIVLERLRELGYID